MFAFTDVRRRAVAAATATVLAFPLFAADPASAAPTGGPLQTVIVEFDATPTIATTGDRARTARDAVAGAERAVTEEAGHARIALTRRRSFSVLVPGMAVQVPSGQIDALRHLPGVKAVHHVERFRARGGESPSGGVSAGTDTLSLIGASAVWKRRDPAGRPARGAGVTVAVIDTGIDYTHPSLGGGFGPGHKVAGGYDFVNGDADPADDNAHGTHVAGIIAGTGAGGPMAVTGVAPDATLMAYKVLDAEGSGTTEDILAGIEAAVDPANPNRADVINMSLGGDGDGTDPVGLAATRAVRAGVVVVAAAGNSGPGERTVGTPAAADGVIAVGASTSGLRLPVADLAAPIRERVQTTRNPSSANPPAQPVTADLIDVGAGTPDDFAKAGNLRGRAVLIEGRPLTGSDPDRDPFVEAERRGAVAAFGHSAGEAGPMAQGEVAATPLTTLGAQDDRRFDRLVLFDIAGLGQYEQLHDLLGAGRVRVTVAGRDATDQIASFSSRGPGPRWQAKPEIVAPGVEIRSSVPAALWAPGVYRFSGTSMASPHVAGAAALLRQLQPKAPASRIGAGLIGSARAVPGDPAATGAGRLDVAAAADAAVTAETPALSFGLADLSREKVTATRSLILRNDSNRARRVRLATVGTATVTPGVLTIAPGGRATATVRVAVTRPDLAAADVTGWVTTDTGLRVPYLLAVRPPNVYVAPDPTDGPSTAFIYTVEPAASAPIVRLRAPDGRTTTVTAQFDHDLWWRAPVGGPVPGTYVMTVSVPTAAGPTLVARTAFDVTQPMAGGRWELAGPNSTGGKLSTTPADPNRLVVAPGYTAGVWVTTDRARTWRFARMSAVTSVAGLPSVIIDRQHADRMWVAVNGDDPTFRGRILRTEDAGRTWRTLTFPDLVIDRFVQDTAAGTLVALTGDTARISRDGGDNWTATVVPWSGRIAGAEFAGSDLFVSTDKGMWRWTGLSGAPTLVRATGAFPTQPRSLAVAGDMVAVAQYDNTVWGSTDRGATWQRLLSSTGSLFALSGTRDTLLADGYTETRISRDRGRSWTTIAKPAEAVVNDVDQWPGDDRTVLLGLEGVGAYATTDGKSFTRLGVPGQTVGALAVTAKSLLAGTEADLYRTPLPAAPGRLDWGLSGGEGRIGQSVRGLAVSPTDPRTLWKLYLDGLYGIRLVRSDDDGATWSELLRSGLSPNGLLVHPADPRQIFVSYSVTNSGGLLASHDGGATWKQIDYQTRFGAMAGDPRDPRRLWLGDGNGLWRSDDGGSTRVKVLDGPVTAIQVDKGRIVVGGTGIRVSTDGGRTFTTSRQFVDGPRPPVEIGAIVATGGVLYAGTRTHSTAGLRQGGRGVLRSTDGGRTWVNVSSGLGDLSVLSLAASPDGRWLFAGTSSGGVYRLPAGR